MFKDKDIYTFVRFGGLNLKKQKGFGDKNYHAPPASRGIYAMPKVAQDLFLIGSLESFQPSVMPKRVKHKDIEHLPIEERSRIFDEEDEKRWSVKSSIRKEFRKTTGAIWHHLVDRCKPNEVLASHGSWIKTDMDVWEKAIRKESVTARAESRQYEDMPHADRMFGVYGKEHLEVFFDEKV